MGDLHGWLQALLIPHQRLSLGLNFLFVDYRFQILLLSLPSRQPSFISSDMPVTA